MPGWSGASTSARRASSALAGSSSPVRCGTTRGDEPRREWARLAFRRAGPTRVAVEAAGIEPASRAATERGSPSSAYVQVSPDPSTQAARLGPVRHSGLSQSARTPRCETSLLNDAILLSETPRGATRYVITYAASARSVSDFAFVFLPGIFTRPTRHPRLAPRTVEVDPVETRTPPQSSQSTCS